ncbi:MAG: ABC transporter substrate-binding protein, partial [Proteobacteria bacterium]|nr:ABC transporter substrate-binding protein [Pseudomonadota bacterium]
LIVAQEKGFFRRHGLDVILSREVSWANIRDKVAVGALDGGQMLAAMPIAATLGLAGLAKPMITALSLDLNGNAVTVSQALYQQIVRLVPAAAGAPAAMAAGLKRLIDQRKAAGAPPLVLGVVFPFSSHNYLLRYWLATAGIDPDNDVRMAVVPPPLMIANLAARRIDGFCVGEPWNQRAVELGIGRVAIASYDIWNNHPEKVLGVARDWASRHPNTHRALIAAIVEAAQWIDDPSNRPEVARIIAGRAYVDVPEDIVAMSMTGTLKYGPDEPPRTLPDFNVFHRYAANFPWLSHAEWTLTQMRRWGQIDESVDIAAVASAVYRPDIFREVSAMLDLPCPVDDRKIEGRHAEPWTLDRASRPIAMGPDRFCDDRIFEPADTVGYLAGLTPSIADARDRPRRDLPSIRPSFV